MTASPSNPANENTPANACVFASPPPPRRLTKILHGLITCAWITNAALLLGLFTWIFLDGQFSARGAFRDHLDNVVRISSTIVKLPMDGPPMWTLRGIVGGATATLAVTTVGLFVGAPRQRRLRSWLALTGMVACWFALATAWPNLAWAGTRWRVGRHINDIERIAAALRADWPQDDDDTPDLGPFSAYPQGNPRVLMLLTFYHPANSTLHFNAIERTPNDGLAFQLIGNEFGSWLEWHPEGSKPASFVGGLETRYALLRASALGNGWFLTQYDAKILE
jgi:hypothetical protein